MRSGGDFVVIWGSRSQDGDDDGVFAREFTASGALMTTEFQVNTYTTGYQSRIRGRNRRCGQLRRRPGRAHTTDRTTVYSRSGSKRDRGGVDRRRRHLAWPTPLADGILMLRYLFGFRGATLTDGAVAGNCTRCMAPEIEAFIEALTRNVDPRSAGRGWIRLASGRSPKDLLPFLP